MVHTVNLTLQTDAVPFHETQDEYGFLVRLVFPVNPQVTVLAWLAVGAPSQQAVTRHTRKGTGNETAVCLTFRQSVTVGIPFELQVKFFYRVCLVTYGQLHRITVIHRSGLFPFKQGSKPVHNLISNLGDTNRRLPFP